jgi:hypothetical protein
MFMNLAKLNKKENSSRRHCPVPGCDFECQETIDLQKHTFKKHPGLQLHCQVEGCDFTCTEYVTLEKHTSWKHRGVAAPGPSASR